MNFTVKSAQNGCRLGSLVNKTQGIVVETPTCMLYTKSGSVPNLSWDVLRRLKNLPGILHVPVSHFVDLTGELEEFGQGLKQYSSSQNFILYTSVHDPIVELPSGYNDKNSVALWNRGGKRRFETEKILRLLKYIQPDMYEVMSDCDTKNECTHKRLRKSYDNSLRFMDACIKKNEESEVLKKAWLFGDVGGGYDEAQRTRWAKELARRPLHGFILEGFHNGGPNLEDFPFQEIIHLIQTSLKELPCEKPRIMHLNWNPENLLRGVEAGIDIFDSTFPYIVTERGGALNFPYQLDSCQKEVLGDETDSGATNFDDKVGGVQNGPDSGPANLDDKVGGVQNELKRPFEINLDEKRYEYDQRPLVPGCTCYTCQTHSRNYIWHLRSTSELLAGILLMVHNLHHYLEFFSAIRSSLKNGTFHKLKELIFEHKKTNDVI